MSDRPDAPFEVLGDPPQAVRATAPLPEDAVAQMLTAPSAPALLEQLGITGQDHEELRALLAPAVADEEMLQEITRLANLLREGAGLEVSQVDLGAEAESLTALQQRLAPGEGLVAILALVVSTATVRT